jgi:hypothetical protein
MARTRAQDKPQAEDTQEGPTNPPSAADLRDFEESAVRAPQPAASGGNLATNSPTNQADPLPKPTGASVDAIGEDNRGDVPRRRRGGAGWQPWQDRALTTAALELRTWEAAHGSTDAMWNKVSEALNTTSGGKIDRSGNACKERFRKVLKAHRVSELLSFSSLLMLIILQNNNTRSLQKTGTNEEVDLQVKVRVIYWHSKRRPLTTLAQNLDEISSLLEGQERIATQATDVLKKKVATEEEAGRQMRDAAMSGMKRREEMIDVGELESATPREKGGQRREKR